MVARTIGSVTVRKALQRRGAEVAGAVDQRVVEAGHAGMHDEDHEGLGDHEMAEYHRRQAELEIEQAHEVSSSGRRR